MNSQVKYMRQVLHGAAIPCASFAGDGVHTEFGDIRKVFGSESGNQYDLQFIKAGLTNEGSNNNSFFFPPELLVAKHVTARLKPFNLKHKETDIIGVIFDSAIADHENRILDLNSGDIVITENGKLEIGADVVRPLQVMVACALFGLVYPEEVNQIVSRVEAGEKVDVSMECWYRDFDFLLENAETQEKRFLKRNSENAYLDDMIGAQVGEEFVRRVPNIEGFLFGGIGQVSKGACPDSVIVAVASDFNNENVIGDSAFSSSGIELIKTFAAESVSSEIEKSISEDFIKGAESMDPKKKTEEEETSLSVQAVKTEGSLKEHLETISMQASKLGVLENKNEELANKVLVLETQVAEANKASEETADAENKELTKVNAELVDAKKQLRGFANLVTILENHSELATDLGESMSEVAVLLQDKDDESLKSFIETREKAKAAKDENEKEIARKAKTIALGLSEDASEEDIAAAQTKAIAALKGSEAPNGDKPGAPLNDEEPSKEDADDKGKPEEAKIVMTDSETGEDRVL